VSAETPATERHAARSTRCGAREISVLFVVDLFNAESATVFVQQLDCGLRLTKDKTVLTALVFVGHQRRGVQFRQTIPRPDRTWRRDLKRQMKRGFPFLPSGSQIVLDAEVAGRVGYHDVGAFHATFVKHTG
jgi:hypothetical protein